MFIPQLKSITLSTLLLITTVTATTVLTSCNKKIPFAISAVVPSAEGDVKVKKDKNNNYNINIDLTRLAESKRLTPPKEYYVVWIDTDNNGTKNIGQLQTSSGFLSKELKSSFSTTSSFRPIRVFITAEDNATIEYPNGPVVLTTATFFDK